MIATESISPRFDGIEGWPLAESVAALVEGQMAAVAALAPLTPLIAAAAEGMAERLNAGGRLIYLGAGTSGRIAAQDAAELPPTFGLDPARTLVLLAGGDGAMIRAAEGAEDDAPAARTAIAAAGVGPQDVAIGLAASGRTPFTLAGIEAARAVGALTVGIFNAPGAALAALCEHPLCAATGAEAVAGSTRMKAGTAQRAILTVLSTAVFLRLGHVHRGRMVAMAPTNAKLRARAVAMVADLTGAAPAQAEAALAAGGSIRAAVVMLETGLDADAARARLAAAGGRLAQALRSAP